MKNPAEQIVQTAIWAYRMHPHGFDLQVVVRNAEAILARWQADLLDNIERRISPPTKLVWSVQRDPGS